MDMDLCEIMLYSLNMMLPKRIMLPELEEDLRGDGPADRITKKLERRGKECDELKEAGEKSDDFDG